MRTTLRFSPLLLMLVLFTFGLVTGILGLRVLSPDEKAELVAYLEVFMRGVRSPGLDPKAIFRLSLEQNARTALFIWAFGLAVIGAPLTCILVFVRGFAAGFGSMFLLREVTSGGLTMFVSGMLPHNLISVPSLLILSALSVSFSVRLLRERPWNYGGLWKMVAEYTWRFFVVALGLLAASLVEAFVSPLLLSRSVGL
ncbi:MAG: stage II sporulation protein M [Firmicutes bacterium]|jgi:stage II sporulation protein M|nr:stage II sporulation protein M [Candidatus Fermentithermobacillaceae bacterium]